MSVETDNFTHQNQRGLGWSCSAMLNGSPYFLGGYVTNRVSLVATNFFQINYLTGPINALR